MLGEGGSFRISKYQYIIQKIVWWKVLCKTSLHINIFSYPTNLSRAFNNFTLCRNWVNSMAEYYNFISKQKKFWLTRLYILLFSFFLESREKADIAKNILIITNLFVQVRRLLQIPFLSCLNSHCINRYTGYQITVSRAVVFINMSR